MAGIKDRLERLENAVKTLNHSVDETLHNLSVAPQRRDSTKTRTTLRTALPSEEDKYDSPLYIGPSHSFSFLQEASAGLERLPQQEAQDTRQGAISEVSNIASNLTTARIGNPVGLSSKFHVPSRSVGYARLSSKLNPLPFASVFTAVDHNTNF